MNKYLMIIGCAVLLAITGAGCGKKKDKEQAEAEVAKVVAGAGANSTVNSSNQVACTQEAKICKDGSSVGRSGANCEFAKCPNE